MIVVTVSYGNDFISDVYLIKDEKHLDKVFKRLDLDPDEFKPFAIHDSGGIVIDSGLSNCNYSGLDIPPDGIIIRWEPAIFLE